MSYMQVTSRWYLLAVGSVDNLLQNGINLWSSAIYSLVVQLMLTRCLIFNYPYFEQGRNNQQQSQGLTVAEEKQDEHNAQVMFILRTRIIGYN